MKKTMLALAGLAIIGSLAGTAVQAQDKKILAVVVKGLDNPFFTVMGEGSSLRLLGTSRGLLGRTRCLARQPLERPYRPRAAFGRSPAGSPPPERRNGRRMSSSGNHFVVFSLCDRRFQSRVSLRCVTRCGRAASAPRRAILFSS